MTVPAGTFQTYQAVGNAEDFHDAIYDISPTETPFQSLAKRLKARNPIHQWLADELKEATQGNAVVQGDDAGADTAIPALNLSNVCQLMEKVPKVSTTQEATDHYGRESEMRYQMAKRVKELKRDLEMALVGNNAATAGIATDAAKMAGLESWLAYGSDPVATLTANGTSVKEGALGTTPGFTVAGTRPTIAPTDSTSTGSVSETILKSVIAQTYIAGGDASVIMANPLLKQKLATFAGIATRYRDVPSGGRAQIIGGADLYVSDFGEHKLVPNRFMRSTTIFGIDPEYVGVAYLMPFSQKDLALTGHAIKKLLSVQATLVVQNPFAHFKIGDVSVAKSGS